MSSNSSNEVNIQCIYIGCKQEIKLDSECLVGKMTGDDGKIVTIYCCNERCKILYENEDKYVQVNCDDCKKNFNLKKDIWLSSESSLYRCRNCTNYLHSCFW